MRALLLVLALASASSCKHADEQAAPAASATVAAAQPAPPAPAQPPPDASAASSDLDACASDADCSFTHVDEGACCPTLCSGRVVTKRRADAIEKNIPICNQGKQCPVPFCRPPPFRTSAVCEQGRCVGKKHSIQADQ